MPMTASEVKKICDAHPQRAQWLEDLKADSRIPDFLKTLGRVAAVQVVGNWLFCALQADLGVSTEEAHDASFVLGQYAVHGDIHEHAARIYNEHMHKKPAQKPGAELGEQLINASFKRVPEGLKIDRIDGHRVGK